MNAPATIDSPDTLTREPFKPGPAIAIPSRRDLRIMRSEAAAFSVAQGIGDTFIPAFALALGMGDVIAGLVAAVPQVSGAMLQLAGPLLVRRIRSYRLSVACCASLQAASFIPLVIAAMSGRIPVMVLFAVVTLYWAGTMGAGPPWNTWMGTVIPGHYRPHFFASRNRVAQASLVAGVMLAGAIVQFGNGSQHTLAAFAVIFTIAAVARFSSARFLTLQPEPVPFLPDHRDVSVRSILSRLRHSPEGRLLLLFTLMQTTVQIAGPYFNPFLLSRLGLPYWQFTAITSAMVLAKIVALPSLGRLAQRFGARRLLLIGGLGIIPLPALWLPSGSFAWLVGVQLFSGATWAAWELAAGILFVEGIPEHERTSLLTYNNMANALAVVAGAMIGKLILDHGGASHAAYMLLFAISFGARLLSLPLLARVASRHA